jgi:hypothetical protein
MAVAFLPVFIYKWRVQRIVKGVIGEGKHADDQDKPTLTVQLMTSAWEEGKGKEEDGFV